MPNELPAKNRRRRVRLLLWCAGALCALVVLLFIVGAILVTHLLPDTGVKEIGVTDFATHHQQYEAIVAAVKAMPPPAASSSDIKIQGLPVCFAKDAAGKYTITIIVHDNGHFGCAGYLYSDGPFKHTSGDPYTNIEAPGDLWTAHEQVGTHWMVIDCNLH